ncbi:hypothetical protein [Thiolinea disciformis]|uniref:hypothetical protein n=1 Tax=Thiolinea disciformis TaxID=125614 RepID=UPI00037F98B3|nr:hypothetical protein [Thiolinea disciformis]
MRFLKVFFFMLALGFSMQSFADNKNKVQQETQKAQAEAEREAQKFQAEQERGSQKIIEE